MEGNEQFIKDMGKEYGIDLTVHSRQFSDEPKIAYKANTRVDESKYMFEIAVDLDTPLAQDEVRIRELHDSLKAMQEAINGELK
jgi:hypothetical protein